MNDSVWHENMEQAQKERQEKLAEERAKLSRLADMLPPLHDAKAWQVVEQALKKKAK